MIVSEGGLFFSCSKRYVIQANTTDDRKAWLEVMEGKEPVYTSLRVIGEGEGEGGEGGGTEGVRKGGGMGVRVGGE